MNPQSRIVLFEPRTLIRHGLAALLCEKGHQVVTPLTVEQLTEEICLADTASSTLLISAAGAKEMLFRIIRVLHSTRLMAMKRAVYLPQENALLERFFLSAGADYCLTEQQLPERFTIVANASAGKATRDRFSPSELNVLLDLVKGMETREIAALRKCNYKTVFTFKNNARVRMEIKTKTEWLTLITDISQLQEPV